MSADKRPGEAIERQKRPVDPIDELQAMQVISEVVATLPDEARERVTRWIVEVFGGPLPNSGKATDPTALAATKAATLVFPTVVTQPAWQPFDTPKVAEADLGVDDLRDFFDQPIDQDFDQPIGEPEPEPVVAPGTPVDEPMMEDLSSLFSIEPTTDDWPPAAEEPVVVAPMAAVDIIQVAPVAAVDLIPVAPVAAVEDIPPFAEPDEDATPTTLASAAPGVHEDQPTFAIPELAAVLEDEPIVAVPAPAALQEAEPIVAIPELAAALEDEPIVAVPAPAAVQEDEPMVAVAASSPVEEKRPTAPNPASTAVHADQPMVSMIHGFVEEFQKLARDWDAAE